MAIKIPSKHIYSMDNPKIRGNFIDNVEVNMTVVEPNNDYKTPVYNEPFYEINLFDAISDPKKQDRAIGTAAKGYSIAGAGALNVGVGVYCLYNLYKNSQEFYLKIPKLKNNSFINKLFCGIDENGNNEIKYSLKGYKKVGTVSATFDYYLSGVYELTINPYNIVYSSGVKGQLEAFEIPKTLLYTEQYDYNQTESAKIIASAEAKFYNSGSVLTVTPSDLIENEKEFYTLKFDITMGVRTTILSGIGTGLILGGSGSFNASGEYVEYEPTEVEITIYGNTIGISLTDGTVTYGSGTKPFSLDRNELLQDSATTNGILTTQHLADNILAQYQNGKETATLLCDIGEYYEENGTKVIGIEMQDRMSFHEHDLVIPYVFGADGKDRPMSKYSNGEPKVFEVVSAKRFFDGAVWQELSLLEFTKTT